MILITDSHGPRLERVLPSHVLPVLGEQLEASAGVIAEDAAFSIRDGAISGKGHVPAPPGGPPNADTHDLDQSIRPTELVELPGSVRTAVIADSDHALYQERGTSKMEARPFIEPATERHRAATIKGLADRFREMLTRG